MNIEVAFQKFLLAKRADGMKRKTLTWYKAILNPLLTAFEGEDIEDISTDQMREYVADLRERDSRYGSDESPRPEIAGELAYETVKAHVTALKSFWNWLYQEYQLAHNPMQNIRRPPRRSPEPKAISLSDFRALIKSTGDDLAGKRDRALLMFLLDTGCRSQGLLGLTIENLELDEYRAYVVEKGSKRRALHFTDHTAELLRLWLAERPQITSAVFCSLSSAGTRYGQPMTYGGFRQLMRDLKAGAGVTGRVNPHSFRHAYAREYLRNGGDLATLSRLMGHADSVVTSWYYGVFTAEELAAMHRKHSPVNRIVQDIWDSD